MVEQVTFCLFLNGFFLSGLQYGAWTLAHLCYLNWTRYAWPPRGAFHRFKERENRNNDENTFLGSSEMSLSINFHITCPQTPLNFCWFIGLVPYPSRLVVQRLQKGLHHQSKRVTVVSRVDGQWYQQPRGCPLPWLLTLHRGQTSH